MDARQGHHSFFMMTLPSLEIDRELATGTAPSPDVTHRAYGGRTRRVGLARCLPRRGLA